MEKSKSGTQQMLNVDMRLKGINLAAFSVVLPSTPDVNLNGFHFELKVENRFDPAEKHIFITTHINILCAQNEHKLGNISTVCTYYINNFEEVMTLRQDGSWEIPRVLSDTLNSISISTTRGVMYSTFRDTILSGAVLPIVVPASLAPEAQ